jgi:hypothetical protein
MNARKLARLVAIQVAKDQYELAVISIRLALEAAQNDAEPQLVKLKAEVKKLQECLAYHYAPHYREREWWWKHCDKIDAAGGTPPDETKWRVELALEERRRRTKE